jgi:uncharacterized protein YceK
VPPAAQALRGLTPKVRASMPSKPTLPRVRNVGIFLGVTLALTGCGAATNHDPPSEKAQIARAVAGVHAEGATIEACEGMRQAGITWARTLSGVAAHYGEPSGNNALTRSDEDSYRVEEAGKKAAALLPALAEPVGRFAAALGRIRHATGEGLQALTAAGAEAVAAWRSVFVACEAAMVHADKATTEAEAEPAKANAGRPCQEHETTPLDGCKE